MEIGTQLAEALEFLHAHKLVHRDIKPGNVIFVNGRPKFADIGLVTEIRDVDETRTQTGSPGYIAPDGAGTAVAPPVVAPTTRGAMIAFSTVTELQIGQVTSPCASCLS